jgi:hypothetical protein
MKFQSFVSKDGGKKHPWAEEGLLSVEPTDASHAATA